MSEPIDATDWKSVAVQLAATSERACRVIEAADMLAVALRHRMGAKEILKALEAYEQIRRGQ